MRVFLRYRSAAPFLALWLCVTAGAQTYITDSLLTRGIPLMKTSAAPGTAGAVGLVHSTSNHAENLLLLDTNPWGVRKGSGTVSINYTGSGSILTAVDLTGLTGAGVDGSPFVLLGCDQWANCFATGKPTQFPKQLSEMSSLVVDYSYSLSGDIRGHRDIDMIWDEWVCNSSHPKGIPDCLEVEILPYYSFHFDHDGAIFVRTVTVPMRMNGNETSVNLDEYTWSQAVLYIPRKLPGFATASIRFEMLNLLKQAVHDFGNSSFSWLMGMEAGTEFGANAAQSYTFTLTKFDIEQTLIHR